MGLRFITFNYPSLTTYSLYTQSIYEQIIVAVATIVINYTSVGLRALHLITVICIYNFSECYALLFF